MAASLSPSALLLLAFAWVESRSLSLSRFLVHARSRLAVCLSPGRVQVYFCAAAHHIVGLPRAGASLRSCSEVGP
eukprot:3514345-Pyramimonas_sp.AAC.1